MTIDDLTLVNNEFLRQFEVKIEDSLARIEYSEQERKIFSLNYIFQRRFRTNNLRKHLLLKFLSLFQKI